MTLPPQSSASTNSATSPKRGFGKNPLQQHVEKRVPRTGLEPARLAAHAPETCASTNSATWAFFERANSLTLSLFQYVSGKRDSDPRPQPWQGCALPTELFPQESSLVRCASLLIAGAKVQHFSEPPKLLAFFFRKSFIFLVFPCFLGANGGKSCPKCRWQKHHQVLAKMLPRPDNTTLLHLQFQLGRLHSCRSSCEHHRTGLAVSAQNHGARAVEERTS